MGLCSRSVIRKIPVQPTRSGPLTDRDRVPLRIIGVARLGLNRSSAVGYLDIARPVVYVTAQGRATRPIPASVHCGGFTNESCTGILFDVSRQASGAFERCRAHAELAGHTWN